MHINDMTIIIGGDAGQGVESSGAGFCKALTRAGLYVFSVQDNRSRIRGGHNFYIIKTSDRPIDSWTEPVHLVVALTPESIEVHRHKVVPGGAIIFEAEMKLDPKQYEGSDIMFVPVPLNKIAQDVGGSKIMANTAALGAVAGLTKLDMKYIDSVIVDNFKKKGEKIVDVNQKIAKVAHDDIVSTYGNAYQWNLKSVDVPSRMIMNGNQAISIGALAAGCNFTSAYPMTPGTSVFEWLNARAEQYGIVSKQTEDEISALCMAIGAAHVGARAIVPTSGGGFSLMVEALGLAGMIEAPVVLVNAQRPGPSTGFATRTEQSDLLFTIHASQGEFPRIVLAPGDIKQCFESGVRAMNLAEKYQTPVIILTDAFLANSYRTIDKEDLDFKSVTIDRGQLLTDADLDGITTEYKRYADVENGISPRAIPGHPKGVFRTTSDEHNEVGEIVEDAETRNRMHRKRMKKADSATSEMKGPTLYGPKKADITLLCWGSTLTAAKAVVKMMNNKVNMLHFSDLWPLPAEQIRPLLEQANRLIAVEGNYTGQLAMLIRMTMGIDVHEKILKYDGRPFSPEYIISKLKEVA